MNPRFETGSLPVVTSGHAGSRLRYRAIPRAVVHHVIREPIFAGAINRRRDFAVAPICGHDGRRHWLVVIYERRRTRLVVVTVFFGRRLPACRQLYASRPRPGHIPLRREMPFLNGE